MGEDSKDFEITVEPGAGVTEFATELFVVGDSSKTVGESVTVKWSAGGIAIDLTKSKLEVVGKEEAEIVVTNTGDAIALGDASVVVEKIDGDAELGTLSGSGSPKSSTKAEFSVGAITASGEAVVKVPIKGVKRCRSQFKVSLNHQNKLPKEAIIVWTDKKVQLEIGASKEMGSNKIRVADSTATVWIANKGDNIEAEELDLVIERTEGDAKLGRAFGGSPSFVKKDKPSKRGSKKEILLWDIVNEKDKDAGWKNIREVKIPIEPGNKSAKFSVSLQYHKQLLDGAGAQGTIEWNP